LRGSEMVPTTINIPLQTPVVTPEPEEAPRYMLLSSAFIDDGYRRAGTIVECQGIPGEHMQPLNDAARQLLAAYRAHYATLPGRRFAYR
jgi:hypothetical protein